MTTILVAAATYLAFNLFVFLIYWWDKEAAKNREGRISESTLLWLAFLGGSLGAVTAQRLLRHKTHKEPFRSLLMAIVVLHIGLVLSLAIMLGWPLRALKILDLPA